MAVCSRFHKENFPSYQKRQEGKSPLHSTIRWKCGWINKSKVVEKFHSQNPFNSQNSVTTNNADGPANQTNNAYYRAYIQCVHTFNWKAFVMTSVCRKSTTNFLFDIFCHAKRLTLIFSSLAFSI